MSLMSILRPWGGVAAALSVVTLCGCSAFGLSRSVDVAVPTHAVPLPNTAPPVANGAIFQASQYRPLFEDHRARLVGDTITVQIIEKVSATQKSTSTIDKSGTVSAGLSAVPLLPSSLLSRASASGNSANTFEGKGSTENTNNFSGVITATVTEVLPNGHLRVSGEKQIGVNDNVDVLRFSGQIDPRSIQAGNVVASAQIANVRLEHKGRGAQADAQIIGWLARFFLTVLPI
ncbi:MAG: flagellar basal body L-ring protein FlgH [Burkholderiaceae bacterium]|nr:flagellar basal body L-ring protein FlgH [Burkholderiaceae bacterium]